MAPTDFPGKEVETQGPASLEAGEYGIDICQLDYLLTLTPLERVQRHDSALAIVRAARDAGIRYYGFDPRPDETA